MTQDERNTQQIVRAIPWETVALEPDPAEVEKIDLQVPLEWRQTLEQEQERAFDQEVLNPLLALGDDELQQQVRETLAELDINVREVIQELDTPEKDRRDQHLDFDR
jgi:hypothetical protein